MLYGTPKSDILVSAVAVRFAVLALQAISYLHGSKKAAFAPHAGTKNISGGRMDTQGDRALEIRF